MQPDLPKDRKYLVRPGTHNQIAKVKEERNQNLKVSPKTTKGEQQESRSPQQSTLYVADLGQPPAFAGH